MFLEVAPGTAALVFIVPLVMEQRPQEPLSTASDELLSAGLCNNLQGVYVCPPLHAFVCNDCARF
jgi:hypothetical protein